MRIVAGNELIDTIEQLCIRACYALPRDVEAALQCARREEPWPLAQHVLDQLMDNARIAQQGEVPICQDTGMAVVVLRIGQQVQIAGGALRELVDEGVRRGYRNGYLRKSVVQDPLRRVNTLDNTPALLHVELVPGDAVEVTVVPKGFGSENMSRLAMLKPADGEAGVRPVSYTHLDVYKRQMRCWSRNTPWSTWAGTRSWPSAIRWPSAKRNTPA